MPVPYKPVVKAPNDTSNFTSYPESDTQPPALKPGDDPFLEWWFIIANEKNQYKLT